MYSSKSNILIPAFFPFLEAFKILFKSNYSIPTLQRVQYPQIPHSDVCSFIGAFNFEKCQKSSEVRSEVYGEWGKVLKCFYSSKTVAILALSEHTHYLGKGHNHFIRYYTSKFKNLHNKELNTDHRSNLSNQCINFETLQ